MPVVFKCTHVRTNKFRCLIDGDFEDSGDDTGVEYESD